MPIYERAKTARSMAYRRVARSPKVMRVESTYGSFPGGDPREFSPDPECSTDAERKAHAEACAAWDRGERPESEAGGCEFKRVGDGVLKVQRGGAFGLGMYQIEIEALEVTYPDGSVRVFM